MPGIDRKNNVLVPIRSTRKRKSLSDALTTKVKWNIRDPAQVDDVKKALHLSTDPSSIVCREEEQRKVIEICKSFIEHEKSGSLYVCGCPGTGKSLSIEKAKEILTVWAKEQERMPPDALTINCTTLANASEIFSMITERVEMKKSKKIVSPLKHLQKIYSLNHSIVKMMIIIVDELDYLITKDRRVLHDLFMLTTLPFARCILIGISNAIDLADRFLPELHALNCKPTVITFRAYSMGQILKILQQRLMTFPYTVFQPKALELCARKVAAASGDMRKALAVCRDAIEVLEAKLVKDTERSNHPLTNVEIMEECATLGMDCFDTVNVGCMALALSRAYKSSMVDIIQSLPQHQQIILCCVVKLLRIGFRDATIYELNKSYIDNCKSMAIPPIGFLEFSSISRVLADQGMLKMGHGSGDKLNKVSLKVDEADVIFALEGVGLFRKFLQ